jgi:ATP/maltotriose-dependent transcriptional regulator MalT
VKDDELYRLVRFSYMEHLLQIRNFDAAKMLAQFALDVYTAVDRRPDHARAKCVLGRIAMQSGATEDCLTMLREAAVLAEAAGEYRVRLDAMIALARAEARYGNPDAAAAAVDVALRMARQSDLRPREMEALISSGWLHVRRGDLPEARRLAAMVLDQSSAMEYDQGVRAAEELMAASAERL